MVLCATTYLTVTRLTHWCIIRDLVPLSRDWKIQYGDTGEDALISRARSMALTRFLDQTSHDVFVTFDADIRWQGERPGYPGGDLARIARIALEHDALVAGVYPKRVWGAGCAVRFLPGCPPVIETGVDVVYPAECVSSGFMAISRGALQRIAKQLTYTFDGVLPFCLPVVTELPGLGDVFLSEDWALCLRATAAGVPVLADMMPVLKHGGEHEFTVHDALPASREWVEKGAARFVEVAR
jgi:hypothetical protein